jgi:uncharacterized protein (DUF1501 family)
MAMQRRQFMQAAGATTLTFAGFQPAWAQIDAAQPRLLVVLLRGGMDALASVPPVGEAGFSALRPSIAVQNVLRLDGSFGLHPAFAHLHQLWGQGQLAIVHSTGFSYAGRSHFEGQDVMQSGMAKPYTSATGWLGRAMQTARVAGGVSISIPMPLILRGNPESSTQFPNWMPALTPAVADALEALWSQDPMLSLYAPIVRAEAAAQRQSGMNGKGFAHARSLPELGRLAGQEMAMPQGPRVGLIDFTHGFDTHASQGADQGGLADQLGQLDRLVQNYQQAMGPMWANALVVTVTEFGRTVAENGTTGTDHGVGSCCLMAGGLVQGAKVFSDWRGLGKEQLFEGRDLPPSIDVAAVYARVIERVFQLTPSAIQAQVIAHQPHSALKGLLGLA